MKKRFLWLIVSAAVLLLTVTVGVTFAILVASSNEVRNTFTVGDVSITLTESAGTEFIMTPGVDLLKDPTVTVKAQSEDCWLFVRVEKSTNFDSFCNFEIDSGWTVLQGADNVYYRRLERSAVDRAFKVLKNDRVTVRADLTEEQLQAVSVNPKLNVTAYAMQSDGFSQAFDAWQELNR